MSELFIKKLKHQGALMYLGTEMNNVIESGKLNGEKLELAVKKQNILLEAAEFINELFYKYEEVLNLAKYSAHERSIALKRLQELELAEQELEATRKAWQEL